MDSAQTGPVETGIQGETPTKTSPEEKIVRQDSPTKTLSSKPSAAAVYSFETAWTEKAPAEIASRYAVPSTAETVIRSARLTEHLSGKLSSLKIGDGIELPLSENETAHGRVNFVQVEASGQVLVSGELTGGVRGVFSLGEDDRFFGGAIIPHDGAVAYQIETGRDGAAYLLEKSKDLVVCAEFPGAVGAPAAAQEAAAAASATGVAAAATAGVEYQLSSRPSAPAVAYLDFDGETVTDSNWNGGNTIPATSSGLSAAQITEIWERVSEDFLPFNIDVTTSRSRYDSTPAGRRMRCIVTQTNGWYGSVGGVAMIGSWARAGTGAFGTTIPCWVFSNLLSLNTRYVAEAASHEIGHTLGLSHDGLQDSAGNQLSAYYSGHGSSATSWAPIMGSGYYCNLVQWSDGNYGLNGNSGNNRENDLALISDPANHAGYLGDDAGGSRAAAAALRFNGSQVSTSGLVEKTGDIDFYRFTTGGGSLSLTLMNTISGEPNLDARLLLYNESGSVLADGNPTGSLYPSISATLQAGTYYVAIAGTGEGSVPGVGYTSYGSLGHYEISGSGTAFASSPVIVADASDSSATTVGTWEKSTYTPGYYGSNYLTDKNTGGTGGRKVRFAPALPVSGAYNVYLRWTSGANRANNVPVDVLHAAGTATRTVNQQTANGTWVLLGTYNFYAGTTGSVTVRNDGANGYVIADAVKFEKTDALVSSSNPTVTVDAADAAGVAIGGTWTKSTYWPGYYGSDYLSDGKTGAAGGRSVSFTPDLPSAGSYYVYGRWIAGSDRASNVPVDVATSSGVRTVTVDQRSNGAAWVLLGAYSFNAGRTGGVTFRNDGANGFVTVDAVRFEKAP